ncbi:uncharacterized protein LOC120354668 [Nilaparvata lugens]|uniref:uncharacterized protein LOC120354668 n=1 Tax=Nilaparvata lugens TaxID=108931 RepID=UPI00193CB224|nr:uncharacterized protein LOC120354668 [Nilaparvata lugens]
MREGPQEIWIPSVNQSGGNPTIQFQFGDGITKFLLVDSGAEISILREPIPHVPLQPAWVVAKGATGALLGVQGAQTLDVEIAHVKVRHTFIIATIDTWRDGLIGWDLYQKLGLVLDGQNGTVTCGGMVIPLMKSVNPNKSSAYLRNRQTLTIWTEPGDEDKHDPTPDVMALENRVVPPYCESVLKASVKGRQESVVMVEPTRQPQAGLQVAQSLNIINEGMIPVKVINFTAAPVTVDRYQLLGMACLVDNKEDVEQEVVQVGLVEVPITPAERKNEITNRLSHLSSKDSLRIQEVLMRYLELFEEPGKEGCNIKVEHHIPTSDSASIAKRPYRVPFHLRPVVEEHLADMLNKGIITPSTSPWSAPVVLVRKRTTDGTPKWRFCTDF